MSIIELFSYFSFQVIIEKYPNSDIQDLDKRKFIVPDDLTFAGLLCLIRRRINIPPEKAIFMFVENALPPLR